MTAFTVTFFTNYAATRKTEQQLSLDDLANLVQRTTAAKKDALPWLKFARFGMLSKEKGSLRWDGNVQSVSGAVADYDGERITVDEAVETLEKAGIIGLVYTSPSHFLNGHGSRWRVCCPFAEELAPDQHYRMMARLNGLFGGALAPESFTLSQAYFFGSVNQNPKHQAVLTEGMMTIDRCDELDQIAIGKPNGHSTGHEGGEPETAIDNIRAALAIIPNPIPSWGPNASWIQWNNFGMAVWRASGGSAEGFEEFDKWSQKSPKYNGDETAFRWRRYANSPPSKIGFGTLVHFVRQIKPKWRPPVREIPVDDEWERDLNLRIIANSQSNIRLALSKLDVRLSHDTFANRTLIAAQNTLNPLSDAALERLWLTIDGKFYFRPTLNFFEIVVRDTAHNNDFHPVRDYLDNLKWDEKKRLDNWLFTYGRAPKGGEGYNNYVRRVGRIALIAAVRRVRQPGCKFDEMLVLINETQGTDKSTALMTLAVRPEWFTDSLDLGATDKKALEQQQGKWIAEMPEMRGRKYNSVDQVKAFLSRAYDRARLSYERLPTEAGRQCVFFGSTNDVKFLRDRSGNRRFWPIFGVQFNVATLKRDRDHLWAEAAAAERSGESIRLPQDLWSIAETVQTKALEADPWAEIIATALAGLTGKIRSAEIWLILDINAAQRTSDADSRMGSVMRELGWERKTLRFGHDPEGCYVKGNTDERANRIIISRDSFSRDLQINRGHAWWRVKSGTAERIVTVEPPDPAKPVVKGMPWRT